MVSSPQPDEIEQRSNYFVDWVRKLGTSEDEVVDEASAKDYIRDAFDQDPSLSNLRQGMDVNPSIYDSLVNTDYIQDLIKKNSGEKVPSRAVSIKLLDSQTLSRSIPRKNRVARRQVINRIFTFTQQQKTSLFLTVNKNGITNYRDEKGRFVKESVMLRRADQIIKVNRTKRAEINRLISRLK